MYFISDVLFGDWQLSYERFVYSYMVDAVANIVKYQKACKQLHKKEKIIAKRREVDFIWVKVINLSR